MPNGRIIFHTELSISEAEARLIFSYVETANCSVPEALADLITAGLTCQIQQFHAPEKPATFPPLGLDEVLPLADADRLNSLAAEELANSQSNADAGIEPR